MSSRLQLQLDSKANASETHTAGIETGICMSENVDCVVIGAGVVGLAVGRALAQSGREVIVLDGNAGIGEETSSRNSEVIHGGLYYPSGSLKARLCVSGKQMLYEYCEARQVPYKRCGKLIVATDASQLDRLKSLAAQASRNGVNDIERLDAAEIKRREPAVEGIAGLWSPSTGIIDSHALMLALQGDMEAAGGIVATQTSVRAIHVGDDAVHLTIESGGEQSELTAETVVNSAGLGAVELAALCTGVDTSGLPPAFFAKGNYFIYGGASPFHTLVYPLPVDGGLGIHATLDLGGKLRFGPDVQWIDAIDYSVDPTRRNAFAESIRTYWPAIEADDLVPGYAGIRPKLAGPGEPAADFRIDVAASGARRLVHLLGIESPGLTASLAIADEVGQRIEAAASGA
jgi:L-2-hydroxyglutarate oxidase LhgO